MNYDREQVATVYAATFAARTDAYTRWNGDHWQAIREPLSAGAVIRAFEERQPLSGYTVGPDNTTHVAALDFDVEDGEALAFRVARMMWANGAPAFVERSRRGAHVWSVLHRPLSAIVVRRALRAFLQFAEIAPDPKIELRPGSDRLSDDGLGFALRMPTMHHPLTGKRYPMLDPESGGSIGNSLAEILLAFDIAPSGAFELAAEQWTPPRKSHADPEDRPPRPKTDDSNESAVAVLTELWGVQFARPGKAIKCPAHDDRHPSLSILPDDKRAVCHAPGCELNNDGRGRGTYELRKLGLARQGVAV